MKLLSLTAIEEFGDAIKNILQQSGVKQFTYMKVNGYRDSTSESLSNNWFAAEVNETQSLLFWAFAPEKNVHTAIKAVTDFNAQQQTSTKIHLFTLQIEQSI